MALFYCDLGGAGEHAAPSSPISTEALKLDAAATAKAFQMKPDSPFAGKANVNGSSRNFAPLSLTLPAPLSEADRGIARSNEEPPREFEARLAPKRGW